MELTVGAQYQVTVAKILPIGAIVTIGSDPNTYLIHISNIANTFVKDPEAFISVGMTYTADAVEGKVKPVELSLKALDLKPEVPAESYARPQPPKDPPKIPDFEPYQKDSKPRYRSESSYSGAAMPIEKDPYGLGRPARRPQNKKPYGNKGHNQRNRRNDYD
jgi:predicted RNA-binding protein with RPS1 domain